jgi:hypothetical protein
MPTALLVTLALAAVPDGRDRPGRSPAVSYVNDVSAVLVRAGCNSGACHGNLNGKGGFKLSLRGEDPAFDHAALTRDVLGRRVNTARPDASLVLQKAAGRVPHEGGARFGVGSPEYWVLRDWIAAGAPNDAAAAPAPVRLEVTPTKRVLAAPADRLAVRAVAHYADGSSRDVTGLSAFDPNTVGAVRVTPAGEIVRLRDGESVVIVRYRTLQVPVRVAFVPDAPTPDVSSLTASGHPIDRHVAARLAELRLAPSAPSTDEVFVRRAFLDAIGVPPTAAEARAFLLDRSPGKRERLVDDLLARPEFAEYWAMIWSDLLRNEEKSLDRKGVQVYHRWIKDWVAADRPLNEFAREILSARGSTYSNPAANFYRAVRDPYGRAEAVAQVFLGVRVSCARCHNHPFDRWTQDDYHRFAAFFPRVGYRVLANDRKDDLDKHEFVGEQVVYADRAAEGVLPRTGEPAVPKTLGDDRTPADGADRLGMLADWVADPANPFFAKAQANRVWFHLLGRGLVDPNDDFRASNPPSNPELLDHLAAEFRRGGFRLRPLVRHVMTSRVYALSATPNGTNREDETHFSRAIVQPLEAEQLLDAMARALGVPPRFRGYPAGMRAGAVPAMSQADGSRRRGGMTMSERFLKVFGKPDRLLTCECERTEDAGLVQAFQLINGEQINQMLRAEDNRLGQILAAGTPPREMLDELYLGTLSRFPTDAERGRLLAYVDAAGNRRAAWEDVAWGLVNAKEFLLRR